MQQKLHLANIPYSLVWYCQDLEVHSAVGLNVVRAAEKNLQINMYTIQFYPSAVLPDT